MAVLINLNSWLGRFDLLPLTTVGEEGDTTTRPGDAATVHALATSAGVDVPMASIVALLDAADVSEQGAFEAMARTGLQIVQVAE